MTVKTSPAYPIVDGFLRKALDIGTAEIAAMTGNKAFGKTDSKLQMFLAILLLWESWATTVAISRHLLLSLGR